MSHNASAKTSTMATFDLLTSAFSTLSRLTEWSRQNLNLQITQMSRNRKRTNPMTAKRTAQKPIP